MNAATELLRREGVDEEVTGKLKTLFERMAQERADGDIVIY